MLIDKPGGMTSHDVVARARKVLTTRAVGHTGTLDPFATGLMVLLLGRATRLARFVEQQPKTYLATARLGVQTRTDDLTGEPLHEERSLEGISAEQVRVELDRMVGVQMQEPPAFSAKRIEGERSYRLAREGRDVKLAPAEITVHRIQLLDFTPPMVWFRTQVSPGTYIRAMARDLGTRLGVGGHLKSLRREAIGPLSVEDAIPLGELTEASRMLPVGSVLSHLKKVDVSGQELIDVGHGRPVRRQAGGGEFLQLVSGEQVLAIAREDGGWLRPVVVLESR